MRRRRFWGLVGAVSLMAFPLFAAESYELALGSKTAKVGADTEVPLVLSATGQVQGLVAAFDWDAGVATGVDLVPASSIASADVVVKRVEAGYMVLGVVVDNDGVGENFIPPGEDIVLATVKIRCKGTEASTALTFKDAAYATVDGGPLLENIVVVGGLSIGAAEGLVLTDGRIECVPGFNRFYVDSATATSDAGRARILMENLAPVEGYVTAVCHPAADLTLTAVEVGAAAVAQGADFSAADVFADGGTLGVVIDLLEPYTNNTIPPGDGQEIAIYRYRCASVPAADELVPLTLCDNVLGSPLKENVMVIGGLSVNPVLEDGTFTCKAKPPKPEVCTNGVDDDGDGLVDCDDPDCADDPACRPAEQSYVCGTRGVDALGNPSSTITASLGAETEVCFYILNPEDWSVGTIPQYDHIQGFSMALSYCCDIEVVSEVMDISGTILEAIGAEYVMAQADNDPDDGDGCQLIIGVLVDALPPFDMATIPPTDKVQRMGCVKFRVKGDAPCGVCCPIEFTDGVNARGKVPINNLIAVENYSRRPKYLYDCEICTVERERFFRGDCNFSADSDPNGGAYAVDIADAAAVVSYLFAPGPYKFQPPCLDACDCNDDGRIDLADTVCILRYLFQLGPFPPEPGPGWRETGGPNPNNVEPTGPGEDPTYDLLDCAAGTSC